MLALAEDVPIKNSSVGQIWALQQHGKWTKRPSGAKGVDIVVCLPRKGFAGLGEEKPAR